MKTEALPDVSNDLLIEAVRAVACPLTGAAGDYDPLLDLIGDERVAALRPPRLERAIGVIAPGSRCCRETSATCSMPTATAKAQSVRPCSRWPANPGARLVAAIRRGRSRVFPDLRRAGGCGIDHKCYQAEYVPGLLQTEAYADAVHRAALMNADRARSASR